VLIHALIVAQAEERTRISFDFSLPAIIAIIAGIVILVFPRALNYIVAIYLLVIGAIDLFNINI
jgi:hypothetical protein